MILFDTDICIEILRGNKQVISKRKNYDGIICISFISIAELYYGAEKSGKKSNIFLIEKLLTTLEIINSDIEILKKFGELKCSLEKTGNRIADADLLIASTALTKCDKLITGNVKHFKRIKALKIEDWIR